MKKSWTITDSYKTYDGSLPKKKYVKALKELFWEICNIIIRKRYVLNMGKIGKISIIRKLVPIKNAKKKIDYQYYKKTGKIKYLINLHTDGYYYYFAWTKNRMNKKKFSLYRYCAARGNDYVIGTRGLAKWIISSSKDPTVKDYTSITRL